MGYKEWIFRELLFLLLLLLLLPNSLMANEHDINIENEKKWLISQQSISGALVKNKEARDIWRDEKLLKIVPYFSNLALENLLLLENETNDYAVVKKYLLWYLSYLNVDGSINDFYIYTLSDKKEKNSYERDSVDSYGATFLSLLKIYVDESGDKKLLLDNKTKIRLVEDSVLNLMDDGLTFAKADYSVKFLMDNTEVYKGFLDCSWIEKNVFEDSERAIYFQQKAEEVKQSILKKMIKDESYFCVTLGSCSSIDLKNFYPDAVSQLFPIYYEIIDSKSDLAKKIWKDFNLNFPYWYKKDKPELVDDFFPWVFVGRVSLIMGDIQKALSMLESVEDLFLTSHNYPWYIKESGDYLVLADSLRKINKVVIPCNTCQIGDKSLGDANCDGEIDLADFEIWRSESFDMEDANYDWQADFNCSDALTEPDTFDFNIWRINYFGV
jgi:hypothetical protein